MIKTLNLGKYIISIELNYFYNIKEDLRSYLIKYTHIKIMKYDKYKRHITKDLTKDILNKEKVK